MKNHIYSNSRWSWLVLISPVFFLTVKHWTNFVAIFLFVSCLCLLTSKAKLKLPPTFSERRIKIVLILFIAPIASILISQALRLDFHLANWDGPLRMLFCIPLFLAVSIGLVRLDSTQGISQSWMTLIFPVTLLWTLLFRLIWPTYWGNDYLTTYFVDPLTFGSYSLLFALLTLLGISENWSNLSLFRRSLCLLGIIAGFYLSLKSGARTGWFNLPIFFGLWMYFILKPKLGLKNTFALGVVLCLVLIVMFSFNNNMITKFKLILTELSSYKLNEVNLDNSVGLRLSFYKMGATYFFENPLIGWGDLGWMKDMNRPDFAQFASENARETPKHGFHNEIVTNSVRSGIWGLISSISFFGIVSFKAIQGLIIEGTREHRLVSLALLVVISHLFITGLTTEITNLVFLCSFIGITMAVLLGEQIYLENKLST
jgi:O-antigen ligase